MELRKPGPALGRGPAAHGAGPGRGEIAVDGRRAHGHPALTAGFVAGLAVELTGPLQQAWQQRHGLLEVLTATTPPLAAHTRWRIFRAS